MVIEARNRGLSRCTLGCNWVNRVTVAHERSVHNRRADRQFHRVVEGNAANRVGNDRTAGNGGRRAELGLQTRMVLIIYRHIRSLIRTALLLEGIPGDDSFDLSAAADEAEAAYQYKD